MDLTKLTAKQLGKAFEANDKEHTACIAAAIDAGWGHRTNTEIIATGSPLGLRIAAAVETSIALQGERQRRRDWGLPPPA